MSTLIHSYKGDRDREISDLALSIQNSEAGLHLTLDDQPDLLDIAGAYRDAGFWIAVDDREAIVGTIGLLAYGRRVIRYKNFVDVDMRISRLA